MLAVFLVVVLVYLVIGVAVALVMRWLLNREGSNNLATFADCCICVIAWPVVVEHSTERAVLDEGKRLLVVHAGRPGRLLGVVMPSLNLFQPGTAA